ncbi:hypothetical protein ACOMHN_034406 [Nucella lapillus]
MTTEDKKVRANPSFAGFRWSLSCVTGHHNKLCENIYTRSPDGRRRPSGQLATVRAPKSLGTNTGSSLSLAAYKMSHLF